MSIGLIGNRVYEIRKQWKLTQSQLAEMVGVDTSTINKIEKNKATPSLGLLDRIAVALKVSVSDLLSDHDVAVGE